MQPLLSSEQSDKIDFIFVLTKVLKGTETDSFKKNILDFEVLWNVKSVLTLKYCKRNAFQLLQEACLLKVSKVSTCDIPTFLCFMLQASQMMYVTWL